MSIKTPDTAPAADPNTARHPSRTRRLAAAAATVALTVSGAVLYREGSGSDPHGESHSIGHHKTPPTKTPEKTPPAGPMRVEQLPGYGQQVSPEQRKALRASTVQVVRLKPDPTTGFSIETFCTGIKTDIGVVTARHCLVDGLDEIAEFPQLNTSPDPAHDPSLHKAKIVPERLSGKVSIWTVGSNGIPDAHHAIPVDRVAASEFPDMALLRVDDTGPNAGKFDAVQAINYEAATGGKPEPGAQAVLYSLPQSSSKLLETTGTYLGTSANPADPAQGLVAWISIDGSSADKDGCFYEGSGSASMIAGAGVTGPLEVRIQPGDFSGGIPMHRQREWRDTVAADLGVTLEDRNTTLCGFVPPNITQAIAHNMAQVAATQ
jgi:hypothetical protein